MAAINQGRSLNETHIYIIYIYIHTHTHTHTHTLWCSHEPVDRMRLHPLQFITSICYPSLGEEPTQLHCTRRISFHLLTSQSVELKESLRSFTLSSSLIDKVQLPLRPLPRFDHLCSPSFNISIHPSIHGCPEPNLVPLYNCCRDPNPKCAVLSVTFKHFAAIETFLIIFQGRLM